MAISESLLPEFDSGDGRSPQAPLERVPEDKFDWKAAPEVRLDGLAGGGTWPTCRPGGTLTVAQDQARHERPAGSRWIPPPAAGEHGGARGDVRQDVRRGARAGDRRLRGDAELMKPWTLLSNGTELFSLAESGRAPQLRPEPCDIHHRAQLGVYLRINDVPVPSLYGPSADETPAGGSERREADRAPRCCSGCGSRVAGGSASASASARAC